jgi:hypothetical protein
VAEEEDMVLRRLEERDGEGRRGRGGMERVGERRKQTRVASNTRLKTRVA